MITAHRIEFHIFFVLVLAGTLALNAFFFPLTCLAAFASAGIVFFCLGKVSYLFDPVSGGSEGGLVSALSFGTWAEWVTSSPQYRQGLSSFYRNRAYGLRERLGVLLSFTRAKIYVHTRILITIPATGLFVFGVYQAFSSGRGMVWTSPVYTGVFTGAVWGYAAGLYCLWGSARLAEWRNRRDKYVPRQD